MDEEEHRRREMIPGPREAARDQARRDAAAALAETEAERGRLLMRGKSVEVLGDCYGLSMHTGPGLRRRARRRAARARRVLESQGFIVEVTSRRDGRQLEVELVARRSRGTTPDR